MKNAKLVLILGSKGMLGTDLVNVFSTPSYSVVGHDLGTLDITRPQQVENIFREINPDVVINAAAFTEVDQCEATPEIAKEVNANALSILAKYSKVCGAKLIHISTDYVFDGEKEGAYTENDEPHPINVYGESKLEGEVFIQQEMDDYCIIRTSWLFGQNGSNFVKTILRLANEKNELSIVNDQKGRPTYAGHLAWAISEILPKNPKGIINITNSGSCTWFDFAQEILAYVDKDVKLSPVSSEQFTRPAARPKNSILDLSRLKHDFGIEMPHWKEGLKEYRQ